MLVVEVRDKQYRGGRRLNNWKAFDVSMTLDDFTAMRNTLDEKLPGIYAAADHMDRYFGGAKGSCLDLMHALGWIELNDEPAMLENARNVISGDAQVFATTVFVVVATYQCRVTHVDGVKLKRRKCFPEQTYSKWLREQGGE